MATPRLGQTFAHKQSCLCVLGQQVSVQSFTEDGLAYVCTCSGDSEPVQPTSCAESRLTTRRVPQAYTAWHQCCTCLVRTVVATDDAGSHWTSAVCLNTASLVKHWEPTCTSPSAAGRGVPASCKLSGLWEASAPWAVAAASSGRNLTLLGLGSTEWSSASWGLAADSAWIL